MTMTNSSLATKAILSESFTAPRQGTIKGVAIHCTAGSPDSTAETIARVLQPRSRGASCNYAIGGDGSICLVVEEKNRAWCTSSGAVDHNAISIEVASDGKGLVVRPAAVAALIELLADICQRNGIPELKWKADRKLMCRWNQQNMVVHRWTSAKSCPGDFLYDLHPQIAEQVNRRLKGGEDDMTEEQVREIVRQVLAERDKEPASVWAEYALDWGMANKITDGNKPQGYCTREQVVTMLQRLYQRLAGKE